MSNYRGRLAPTPTGLLHAGHAATFRIAHARARAAGGKILLRIEDIDPDRCRPEFTAAAIEDLRWLGLDWDGEPILQSTRRDVFLAAWRRLRDGGFLYPSPHSRREIAQTAATETGEEPIFPPAWRQPAEDALKWDSPAGVNWRFRVPDGEAISFEDGRCGRMEYVAGRDFGDFVVWRRDDVPAYELAVVADDIAMGVTEVVRGEDLLVSTARQLLLYRALGAEPPAFYHCPLVCGPDGRRLAKRDAAKGIRALRAAGYSPTEILTSRIPPPPLRPRDFC